jgi:Protein of unknown function (DUF1592)/Protein of unknown function (DUF1588)/Protein of unknown function (DUF1585)/Protein of unknown function (DUF1587)/Protein of unknown function (DUF1595)/Planctomycete cytochrome C
MNRVVSGSLIALALLLSPRLAIAQEAKLRPFLDAHCIECHGPEVQKSRLRLDTLAADFADAATATIWTRVHDKLASGAMPPKSRPRPPQADLDAAIHLLHDKLHAASLDKQRKEGRVVLRRLNGTEYENSLHDLLDVDISLKKLLPSDNTAAGFDNVSAALEISAAHLLLYQEAAEKAIRATIPAMPQMPFKYRRTGKEITEKVQMWDAVLGKSSYLKGDALVQLARLPDHWRMIAAAPAPQTGRYHVRLSAYVEGTDGKPLTVVFLGQPIGDRVARESQICRDVMPSKHPDADEGSRGNVYEAEIAVNRDTFVWIAEWGLPERYELSLKKLSGPIEQRATPKLVIEWLEIEGPIGPWPPESYRRVFDGVPLKTRSVAEAEAAKRKAPKVDHRKQPEYFWANYDPLVPASEHPKEDAERLIRSFLPRAFRRPVSGEIQKHYVKLVHDRLDQKYSFLDAMVVGYKSILSSTNFLFFQEPGSGALTASKDFRSTRLDDYALANRLAYFLWSSPPDAELLRIAEAKELSKPAVLRAQVDRLLDDPKSHRFTGNFCGQWLDLRKLNDTTPDPQLYGDYDLYLLWSMPRESEMFFEEILRHDRSLLEFVDARWSFLNERLARLYGIAGVVGCDLRKVDLPKDCHRGGVMTQASVLKVTADGTRTSPVLRGKWVFDRILGKPPAPPPPDIPSFEPDIRGATTIRQQLDKHRHTPACASCHVHIDPPGFALENFDVIGGWREQYRVTKWNRREVPGTRAFLGPDVEMGGVTPEGKAFKNIDDYKKLLLDDRDQIARNLTEKLLIYATGAEIQFADREVVDGIMAKLKERNYGLRTLVHEIVESRVFGCK